MDADYAASLGLFISQLAAMETYEDEFQRHPEAALRYTSAEDYLADFGIERLRSEYLGLCALINDARRLRPAHETIDLRAGTVADMVFRGAKTARIRVLEYPVGEPALPELLRSHNKLRFEILTHDPETIRSIVGEIATLSIYDQAEIDVLVMGIKGRIGRADVIGTMRMKEDS